VIHRRRIVDFNRMQADKVTAFDDFSCGAPK
jgi:hypothetical protein